MKYEELNPQCGFYQCSICGEITQVTKVVQVEVENEHGEFEVITMVELDGDESIKKVIAHEETHKK